MLTGKHIVLGVTGSIAAYKAAILTRLLVKNGAEVQVIMSAYAKEFITPLTLATLSKRPILVDFFDPENGAWNSHVDLGLWADAYLIAPATANTIGKMASGVADNLLLTTYLSARCPVFIAPAMDLDMFAHPANQKNLAILQSYGNHIIEPASGELASGLDGKGRMEEPEAIVQHLIRFFEDQNTPPILKGIKVLVTAGPTREAIDPVRFISNYSSGKMGYAIANCLAKHGADVHLVTGPVYGVTLRPEIQQYQVESASEMHQQSLALYPQCKAAILSAAVADYKPIAVAGKKIKSTRTQLSIKLTKNPDIAADLGKIKAADQVLIGFALETDKEVPNALQKLKKKNLDFIVLNSLNDPGAGFQGDTNKITIIDKHNKTENFELKSKDEVANDIVRKLIQTITTK